MMQSKSDATKLVGKISFTGKVEVFKTDAQVGHGNSRDRNVGICFGETVAPHAGHVLSKRAKCRCSRLLPSRLRFVGTSSSGGGETKPRTAYITNEKGTALSSNAAIAIELRIPNKKPVLIMRKSVRTQAHFNAEVLDRND
jgi:hypothetical protein